MAATTEPPTNEFFSRPHLTVVIASLFVALHTVDELVRGEELAPPFIPLVIFAALYPVLPLIVRALGDLALGAVFFVAQIFGHVVPTVQNGPTGSDYTGIFPMIGGAILIGLGVRLLLKERARLALRS